MLAVQGKSAGKRPYFVVVIIFWMCYAHFRAWTDSCSTDSDLFSDSRSPVLIPIFYVSAEEKVKTDDHTISSAAVIIEGGLSMEEEKNERKKIKEKQDKKGRTKKRT